jgi:hypothetical protein
MGEVQLRRAPLFALAALLATSAAAQEERTLVDLSACRLDPQNVVVRAKYDSSPCWEAQDPQVTTEGDMPTVTVNTSQTADICTMNIVIAEYARTVPLAADARGLHVVVNDPDGKPVGSGTAAIAESDGCTAPEPETATASR